MYLAQCLDDDHSCRTAVARAKAMGLLPSSASPDTAAYCRARSGLSARGIRNLAFECGQALEQSVAPEECWKGMPVRVLDGTGLSLPDTEANQAAYPQPSGQAKGCGFPVIYLVGLMSLATGAMLRYATGSKRRGEPTLFRRLHRFLNPGELVLGDRGFCSFGTIAELLRAGVDSVFRMTTSRPSSFREGKRLGRQDRLVEWKRSRWPKWLPASASLPESLSLRMLRFQVSQRGFRTKQITLITTLVDPVAYPAEDLAELYRRRWRMELWLRDAKTTLGMDVLRTKTPAGVQTELAMFILAYNLVRAAMRDTAVVHKVPMDRVSFKSAVVRIRHWSSLAGSTPIARYSWVVAYDTLIKDLSRDLNPRRPDRIEPRVIKRRPKSFPRMTRPRKVLRAELRAG
jgi:hypothetical protein